MHLGKCINPHNQYPVKTVSSTPESFRVSFLVSSHCPHSFCSSLALLALKSHMTTEFSPTRKDCLSLTGSCDSSSLLLRPFLASAGIIFMLLRFAYSSSSSVWKLGLFPGFDYWEWSSHEHFAPANVFMVVCFLPIPLCRRRIAKS